MVACGFFSQRLEKMTPRRRPLFSYHPLTRANAVFRGIFGSWLRDSSLLGVSPAASFALPAAKSAPGKLRRTFQRAKIAAGKEEEEGGLLPTDDDDAVQR